MLRDKDVNGILSKYIDLIQDYTEADNYTRIWDLCQRLYFPMEGTELITSVRDWLNTYEEIPDVEDAKLQDADEELEESNSIGPTWVWEYSRRQLMRGNFQESMEMLTFSLGFLNTQQKTAVSKIIKLIADFENVVSTNTDKTTFWERWAIWREQCKTSDTEFEFALQSQDAQVEKNEEIHSLYDILIGDEECIRRYGTYFEVVLGTAWFAKPQSSLSSLKSLAQDVDNLEEDAYVIACSYILMGQFDDAFAVMGGDLWLHTHLGYALIATGNIVTNTRVTTKSTNKEDILDPIYYSIQTYAQNIAEEFDMWEEAVIYLTCCQSNKEIWVNQLLGDPILPRKDVNRLNSILDVATKCGLSQVEKYIHKGLGHRYEHEKKIRQATTEYGKAEDLKSLDRLAHAEFSQYLKTGKLGDVITDMPALHRSPHYAILIVYQEFREHLAKKRWEKASKAALHLLENEQLPTKFETVLLIDNLQILKGKLAKHIYHFMYKLIFLDTLESKHYYPSNRIMQLIDIFKHITKDASNQDFIVKYYKFIENHDYSSDIITAKIRERLAYKAATAPTVC